MTRRDFPRSLPSSPVPTILLAALVATAACSGTPRGGPEQGETAAQYLERSTGFQDATRWSTVEVSSSFATGTPRRIHFEREAVAEALLAHDGGLAYEAAPLRYPAGTTFVAESLGEDGTVVGTEILTIGSNGAPEFRFLDADGNEAGLFEPGIDGHSPVVPDGCIQCHTGTGFFDPMASFPEENPSRALVLPARYRNATIVRRFLEAHHRGSDVFGPYGGILLSSLYADAREGRLDPADRDIYDRLRERYPELLPFDPDAAARAETTSLLGEPLERAELTDESQGALWRAFDSAWEVWARNPTSEEAIIWVGRRLAYLGRYREAVEVYSRGIELHPESYKLHRHRGHRFITLREFDRAVDDLSRAAELADGVPDEVEPDGAPNAYGIPTSSNQSNIWYHLGLAHYLQGEFEEAEQAYARCMEFSATNDMRVATAYWWTMTLHRLDRPAEAAEVAKAIPADLDLLENHAYHALLLAFQGLRTPASVLSEASPGTVDFSTRAFGLANLALWTGDLENAKAAFELVLEGGSWAAFGHIGAEAELARMAGG